MPLRRQNIRSQLTVAGDFDINGAKGESDAVTDQYVGVAVFDYNYLFNGTTWDRQRGSAGSAFSKPQTASIPVSVTLTVGATYATGDHVGTSGTPISFANAARVAGGSGKIVSLVISDPAASTAAALELWLFNATVTPPADSAAWTISDADSLKLVGVIPIPTTAQFASALNGNMSVNNINLQYTCAATTLFGCLVTRGAPTYTGTLQVKLEVEN